MAKLMRVSNAAADKIDSLSKITGLPKQKILDKALTLYTYEQILKKANAQYATLKKNTKAWKEMQQEYHAWNATLNDGLCDD